MVPFQNSPAMPGPMSDLGGSRASQADPVRFAVHLALAVYLSPVILAVCLIGGTTVMVNGVATLAGRMGRRATNRKFGGRTFVAQPSSAKVGPRRMSVRQRSHAAH